MSLEVPKKINHIHSYLLIIETSHKDKPEAAELISRYEVIRKRYTDKKDIPTLDELNLLLTDFQEFVERAEGITK
ncbi:hypothetical protein CN918_29290 [Priestia megaterium]|nr:hypothetical protein CN918_29290 [Priestia megaterium]